MQQDTCAPEWCESPFHDHSREADVRPALAGMVDPTDPAFEHITRVLLDMRLAGVHLAPATVTAAIKLGRLYHSGETMPPRAPTPESLLKRHVVYYMRFGDLIRSGRPATFADACNSSSRMRYWRLSPAATTWRASGTGSSPVTASNASCSRQARSCASTSAASKLSTATMRRLRNGNDLP